MLSTTGMLSLTVPHEIWMLFLFALGATTGSFLNVVVYRLPLELSIIRPSSHCPVCKHPISWYDNIPIFSWFILRGRCRYCKESFSFRYPLIELFTALMFVALYWVYFQGTLRELMPPFEQGGWLIYMGHIVLLCALLASSLIDAEHWIIPLAASYTAALAGLLLSMLWPYWTQAQPDQLWRLVPYASARSGAAAFGGGLGLIIALALLKFGILQRSFAQFEQLQEIPDEDTKENPAVTDTKIELNIRREMLWEIGFLAPVVGCGLVVMWILTRESWLGQWWLEIITEQKWLSGLLGSVFGFMIGGAVVWATRILGTLAFGREAMGLGDVHLMAAVGAVLGWASPTIAFFVAPFLGLGWALARLVLHRSREIPYGPFLSIGTLMVMIFHDQIVNYFIASFTQATGMP